MELILSSFDPVFVLKLPGHDDPIDTSNTSCETRTSQEVDVFAVLDL